MHHGTTWYRSGATNHTIRPPTPRHATKEMKNQAVQADLTADVCRVNIDGKKLVTPSRTDIATVQYSPLGQPDHRSSWPLWCFHTGNTTS